MWHLSEKNPYKNLNRLQPIKYTRPTCYFPVSGSEAQGHFIEMPKGFFPHSINRLLARNCRGQKFQVCLHPPPNFREMPSSPYSSFADCRLMQQLHIWCQGGPLPCGHRPLEARKAFFRGHRWTFSCGCPQQSQPSVQATAAGSRTSAHWAHQTSFICFPPHIRIFTQAAVSSGISFPSYLFGPPWLCNLYYNY